MSTDLVTISPSAPITDMLETMRRAAVRRLLVVDSSGLLLGVISWKDVSGEIPRQEIGRLVTEVVEAPASSEA
jgi:CBS domain-containing protein